MLLLQKSLVHVCYLSLTFALYVGWQLLKKPEPAHMKASASCATESPQRAHAGSSFLTSSWRKLVAGCCFPQPSLQWYNERAKCITASTVKEIICRRPTTDPARLLTCLTSTHLPCILRPLTMDMCMKEMLLARLHA